MPLERADTASEPLPYAIGRYTNETNRLCGVLDKRLADEPILAGDAYSIADIASEAAGFVVIHGRAQPPNA